MHGACEFCDAPLTREEPENVALLNHLAVNPGCQERFDFMLQNLRSSWTPAMSGG